MNKIALVTGATSGIGYVLYALLAQHNHDLVLVARNEKKISEIKVTFEKSIEASDASRNKKICN